MYRRYRPKNKKSNQTLPIVAVSLTITGLLVWGYFSKWDDIVRYVKGETKYLADNSEANARLDKLIKSLYTDESALIALVDKTTDYNEGSNSTKHSHFRFNDRTVSTHCHRGTYEAGRRRAWQLSWNVSLS